VAAGRLHHPQIVDIGGHRHRIAFVNDAKTWSRPFFNASLHCGKSTAKIPMADEAMYNSHVEAIRDEQYPMLKGK